MTNKISLGHRFTVTILEKEMPLVGLTKIFIFQLDVCGFAGCSNARFGSIKPCSVVFMYFWLHIIAHEGDIYIRSLNLEKPRKP